MEFRYVYRRLEDAIGVPVTAADAPHVNAGRRLRHDFREHRDISHYTEMTALCLASMGGNASIDVSKMSERVSQLLDRALDQKLPYLASLEEKTEERKPKTYDEYFKQLAAMSAGAKSGSGKDKAIIQETS